MSHCYDRFTTTNTCKLSLGSKRENQGWGRRVGVGVDRGKSGACWCPGSRRSFFAGAPWYPQPAPGCRGGRRTGSAGAPGGRSAGSTQVEKRLPLADCPTHPHPQIRTDGAHLPERCSRPGLPGIQWLRLCASDAGGAGSTPAGEDPTGHTAWPKKVKKKKDKKRLLSSHPSPSMRQPTPGPRNVAGLWEPTRRRPAPRGSIRLSSH